MNEDSNPREARNWMMGKANLHGRIGMILCWYWDGSEEYWEQEYAIRGVSLIRKLLIGDTLRFTNDDWWIFFDAMNTYSERDEQLDAVFHVVQLGFMNRLPPGQPTRNFTTDTRTQVWYNRINCEDDWLSDS